MFVTKRDGSMAPLDIKQVRKQTIPACTGLDNVNYRVLEEDVELSLRDGITSKEIQKILIRSAADKISIDSPDYTYVAARLTLYDLYHSIKHYHGKKGSGDVYRMVTLKDYIKKYNNLFSEWYTKYSDEEIDELNSVIDGKRDLLFNYLGVEVLINRYLVRYNGKPVELPQHMHMCIAMFLMQNEKENRLQYIKDFYEETSNLRYINATPINSNGRVKDGGLVSCFLGYVGDSAESIMSMATDTALASKFGAGAGWDWSTVRSASDPIRGYPEAAGGKIPMIKIYADILLAYNQLGTRMGAGCAYIECWDVEIFDFIDLKKKNGDERRRAHDLFLGINVRDFFMQRMINDPDSTMTLFSPYDVPELRDLYGQEFTNRYEKYEKEFKNNPARFNKYTKQVKIMDVYKYMIQSWVESGTPFWHFIDTTNKKHAHPQLGVIRQSNLCVGYDTHILTKEYGNKPIGELVESGVTEAHCWNGEEWSLSQLFKTSDEAELIEVTLQPGDIKINATPYHKWYLIDDSGVIVKETKDLVLGDLIEPFRDPRDEEGVIKSLYIESLEPKLIKEPTYCGNEPKLHKLMFNGVRTGNCTEVLQPTDEDHTAICNLGSLNVSRYVDEETLKKTIKIAVRALDNAIDLTVYPSKKAEITQMERRSIGLGALGEAEYIARHNMYYGSDEHKQFIDRFYKVMSETVHETTKDLAIEKGSCIVDGVRNAYLMCIAPNSTSGSFAGTTNSTEPVYSQLWVEGNKDNEYYVTAPNITKENKKYYESAFVIDPIKQIECTSIRQKYIDMAISTNVHMNNVGLKASDIDKVVKKAWSEGLKTLYYFKTKAVRTITCVGCEN